MRKSFAIFVAVFVFGPVSEMLGASANTPPTISILSPINGATYRSTGEITILALADDIDGRVRSIEFFANETSLGEIRRETLSSLLFDLVRFSWKSPPPGTHTLIAQATDDTGASTKSKPVKITVTGGTNLSASIVITSPAGGQTFSPARPIPIAAIARDPKSYINRVEFFANEDRIGVSEILFIRAPDPGEVIFHSFEWTGARSGNYKLTVRGKDLQGADVTSAPVEITIREIEAKPFVESRLPSGYSPGVEFTVELTATPPEATSVYAVEERIPEGWTSVREISADGVFDSLNRAVKFGPYFDGKPRLLRYRVTPPAGSRGEKTFSGRASADGVGSSIVGASQIGSALFHPADSGPADFVMTLNEITAYGLAWKMGTRWPIDPNPIPMDYVTKAGALWRGGEKYYFDSTAGPAPKWWINAIPRNTEPLGKLNVSITEPLQTDRNRSFIRRDLNTFESAENTIQVGVRVDPSDQTLAQAVEERIPEGVAVSLISHDGVFDQASRHLRWGPFLDNQTRILTYQAAIPSESRPSLSFDGAGSFDGISIPITGLNDRDPENTWIGLNLESVRITNAGSVEITGRGEIGQTYVLEATETFLAWIELTRLTSSETTIQFRDENNGMMRQRFYRIRRVPADE